MSPVSNGAQRASSRAIHLVLLSFLTLALAFGGFIASPTQATAASQIKVVIVVGPVEGTTAKYIEHAKQFAAQRSGHQLLSALGAPGKEPRRQTGGREGSESECQGSEPTLLV